MFLFIWGGRTKGHVWIIFSHNQDHEFPESSCLPLHVLLSNHQCPSPNDNGKLPFPAWKLLGSSNNIFITPKTYHSKWTNQPLKGEFNGISCHEMPLMPCLSTDFHRSCPCGIETQVLNSFESKFDPQSVILPQKRPLLDAFDPFDPFQFSCDCSIPYLHPCSFICQIGFSVLFPSTKNSWSNIPELFSVFW